MTTNGVAKSSVIEPRKGQSYRVDFAGPLLPNRAPVFEMWAGVSHLPQMGTLCRKMSWELLTKAVAIAVPSSTHGVSVPYAAYVRAGRYRPHPRHWLPLAQLAGIGL